MAIVSLCGCGSSGCHQDAGHPPEQVRYDELLSATRPDPEKWPEYRELSMSERGELEQVLPAFYATLTRGVDFSPEVRDGFTAAGLRLTEFERGGEKLVLLHEHGPSWRGGGGYLFRKGGVKLGERGGEAIEEVVVQAPHSFHDHLTGEIGLKVFEKSVARGFFYNTIHRYRARRGERSRDEVHPADMARSEGSVFQVMSEHYLKDTEGSKVFQLHGFKSRKLARQGIDVVVSGGEEEGATALAERVVEVFREKIGAERVALYPRDTDSFGALTNVLGGWCAQHAPGRFVHVEMDLALRERIEQQPGVLVEVLEGGVLRGTP